MTTLPLITISIIIVAFVFEFINGFHDTANAVATAIATRCLEPLQAISVAAIFNLIGAFCGTAVALTIAGGFAAPELATESVILAALLAAISWNLITWFFGIPSSSSHALIGGLLGAIIVHNGFHVINYLIVFYKVILPMFISPLLGFVLAATFTIILHKILANYETRKTHNVIRELQVLSTAFLSFSHGANDAQKTMGIITVALFNSNLLSTLTVPKWVVACCAICMALGTLLGGMRIIKTLSTRVAKLKPSGGFASELSSALLLFVCSRFGMPLSTTHAIAGSIMGAGSISHQIGANKQVVKNIITAWFLTIPACMLLAACFIALISCF